jgi:hypothetical protein
MNPAWKKILFHILLPLIAGLLLYIFTRPGTWIVQQIIPQSLAVSDQLSEHWIMRLLVYSGADFCWSYSFASALFLWKDLSGTKTTVFPIIVLTIVLFFEIIQVLFPAQLTFDWIDLIAAFLAVLLSWFLNRPGHVKKV